MKNKMILAVIALMAMPILGKTEAEYRKESEANVRKAGQFGVAAVGLWALKHIAFSETVSAVHKIDRISSRGSIPYNSLSPAARSAVRFAMGRALAGGFVLAGSVIGSPIATAGAIGFGAFGCYKLYQADRSQKQAARTQKQPENKEQQKA